MQNTVLQNIVTKNRIVCLYFDRYALNFSLSHVKLYNMSHVKLYNMLSTDKGRNLQISFCCCFVYDGVRTAIFPAHKC